MGPYDVITTIYQTLLSDTTINLTPIPTDPADYPRAVPFLRVLPSSGMDTDDIAQSGVVWKFSIHAAWQKTLVQRHEAWLHSDANLKGSLHWAIKKMPERLVNKMIIGLEPEFDLSEEVIALGNATVPIWLFERTISVEIPPQETTQPVVNIVNNPAYPPTLPQKWSDAYDITIIGDIMYLVEGDPSAVQEAEIHSVDLTTNEERTSQISAGIHTNNYHRGLTDDESSLFVLNDGGPTQRARWTLNKIDPSANNLLGTEDLGYGHFTGNTTIQGSPVQGRLVYVAEVMSGNTHLRAHRINDLGRNTFSEYDEKAGEFAGVVAIYDNNSTFGWFVYGIVGCTALCEHVDYDTTTFRTEVVRRPDLDIFLGGNQVQWRGCTIREDHLWVVGSVFSTAEPSAKIGSFKLPNEVIAGMN